MAVNFQTKQRITFTCSKDMRLGAYSLTEGESIEAFGYPGQYYLHVEWAEGAIGPLSADKVNEIAGFEAFQS